MKDSSWVWYYNDGQIEYISNWEKGVKEGLKKGYYPNGKLEYVGVYHNDIQDSIWNWYRDDGSIEHIETWENGEVVPPR